MSSSRWMPTVSSSERRPSWKRCLPCTRLGALRCSNTCRTRSTARDSKMCCPPTICRATFLCRMSPVHSTRPCATVGAITSAWRCSTSSSEVQTCASAPLLAFESLRTRRFRICLRSRRDKKTASRNRSQTRTGERSKEIRARMPGPPLMYTSEDTAAIRPHQASCEAHLLSLPSLRLCQIWLPGQLGWTRSRLHRQGHRGR
mmetsp:Transcript_87262/g.281926  ORF Transcript_87262/g.281926 Transcript_87262/m.281926 type:complete len:202 (+) Transcript_87262:871-1476(+)